MSVSSFWSPRLNPPVNGEISMSEAQPIEEKWSRMPAPVQCSRVPAERAAGRPGALVLSFKEAPDADGNQGRRINLDPEQVKNGLAQLVLSLVKLLHELLERQALRRIESGQLDEAACERLGFTLMKQSEQLEALREAFGLSEEDLNLDLGPLGKLL